jgi:hypothetical protein
MSATHELTHPPIGFARTSGPSRLPKWLTLVGFISVLGSAALAGRLVWEQTVWTWERGPQLVGASLAQHGGLLLFIFPVLLLGWLLVVTTVTVHDGMKTRRVAWRRVAASAAAVAILAVLQLPYGFWQRTFIDRLSPERASELFVFAAAAGDFETLKALHRRGVEINARVGDGTTALRQAVAAGRGEMVEFLLAHGADPRLARDPGATGEHHR